MSNLKLSWNFQTPLKWYSISNYGMGQETEGNYGMYTFDMTSFNSFKKSLKELVNNYTFPALSPSDTKKAWDAITINQMFVTTSDYDGGFVSCAIGGKHFSLSEIQKAAILEWVQEKEVTDTDLESTL